MQEKEQIFVSVIMIYNESFCHSELLQHIQEQLENKYSDYEILLVVSKEQATQAGKHLELILKSLPCIRYIQLSNTPNSNVLWASGLENAIGDFLVLFNPELDPITLIPEAIKLCKEGHDVIVGVNKEQPNKIYRFLRRCSQYILSLADYHLPANVTTFRVLSRRSANAVMAVGNFYNGFFMRIQKTGYDTIALEYLPNLSQKKSIAMAVRTVITLLVTNSSKPLHIMSLTAISCSFFSVLISLYAIILKFFMSGVASGWSSTVLLISLFFCMQFIIMAFLCEYLSRLLDEQGKKESYSVVFEKNSTVMINQDRINVLQDSVTLNKNLVQTGRDR